MTRAEKAAEARRLRDEEGRKHREIADLMGVSRWTVRSWLYDPDGSKMRARKDSYRGTCEECGNPTNGSNGPDKTPKRCSACEMANRGDRDRDERVRVLWEDGVATEAIALEVGLTATQVRGVISGNLRRDGGRQVSLRSLPHRDSRERYKLIAELVRSGLSNAEIAAELGTTAHSVNQMICRARRLGVDMPYRSEVEA